LNKNLNLLKERMVLRMSNKEAYKKWAEYQEKNNMPKPLYPIEAYTQETIDMWKRIMQMGRA
jgi:hypothetical protein